MMCIAVRTMHMAHCPPYKALRPQQISPPLNNLTRPNKDDDIEHHMNYNVLNYPYWDQYGSLE